MEASFFRCLVQELEAMYRGARIRKVYGPAPGVFVLAFDRSGLAASLIMKIGRRDPFCFPSDATPPNPSSPSALTMWLRRQLQARRCMEFRADWPQRRLAIRLGPRDGEGWVILDLREGIFLALHPDEPPGRWNIPPQSGFTPPETPPLWSASPTWPPLEQVLEDGDVWQIFPHLSPALRTMLRHLPEDAAQAMYASIQAGGCGAFYLYDGKGPLVWSDPSSTNPPQVFPSAAECAAAFGKERILQGVIASQRKEESAAATARRKRLTRNLKAVEQEERRLQGLLAQREEALLLQANLYRLNGQAKQKIVKVMDTDGNEQQLELDPRLTIAENMSRRFRNVGKAERGLAITAQRRQLLEAERDLIVATGEVAHPLPGAAHSPGLGGKLTAGKPASAQGKASMGAGQGKVSKTAAKVGEGIRVFRSSDGFRILQGKNSKANHRLVTREASPFDYWLHAADGPGSHVLIRRDHVAQEVPRQTLEEAAVLAGLRSWQAKEGKVTVMVALAKDVRPIKGGSPGQVRVDALVETVQAAMVPDLEARLAIP